MATCNKVIITIKGQNEESIGKGIELLIKTFANNIGCKRQYDAIKFGIVNNVFDLIDCVNPQNPDYKSKYIYIYKTDMSTYNIGNWQTTLTGVFDKELRCPTFYFYKHKLPNTGINSGCNSNFDINDSDAEYKITQTLKYWNII